MQFSSIGLNVNDILAAFGHKPGYIIKLDSATAAFQGLGNYLKGKDLPAGGSTPSAKALGGEAISHLSQQAVATVSTWSGWFNASSPDVIDDVRVETMIRWVLSQYPRRRYPGAMIGSTNGAAVHLGAALEIPWLPQTLLVCLQHFQDPDEPKQVLEWAKPLVQRLLANNPDVSVYQMHDPNQDRVKVPRVAYFRLKQTRLSERYKQFLVENLSPGATLFLLECQYTWLSTRVSDRHYFQFGGAGMLAPEDYFNHSEQITEFLTQHGSSHQSWEPPAPDGRFPESEWGFDPALREDVEAFAREHGYRVRRIVFEAPQDLSPLVADLHRWWYADTGLPTHRLLVESFAYLQPWWTRRLGLVPYWAVFNDQRSANELDRYLDGAEPYDEIYMNLFSNGIQALGQAPIERWRSILNRARQEGQFIGVDEDTYPADLASFPRHYTELKKLNGNYSIPKPLTLEQLNRFVTQAEDRYAVKWIEAISPQSYQPQPR
ncbi:hypothetical protein HJG54_24020 [Leptolyngbya sp. NK1-12]|uniref:Uncharacterized protein n=1 Tax=Leptolyngbya sp. NK1-12 TaxID=2547451 RepID=A0AA96WI62_9CYAN|nr:hypothetical protein [Leptolyngbya sp. NK1-12]WNZ25600.1 hypothetical protein HJG54_24020 [Leptolyngbya sp. NK1-12]